MVAVFVISCGTVAIAANLHRPTGQLVSPAITQGSFVRHGSVDMMISNVRREKGTGHYSAPEGKHYVVLTLTLRNVSDQTITIAPANDTYLKNEPGDVVYLTPLQLDKPFHSGQLLSGETIRGDLSYLTRDTETYRFYAESDWSGGVVPFMLQ